MATSQGFAMLNWRRNVSTNCATFSGIELAVGRKPNHRMDAKATSTNALLRSAKAMAPSVPLGALALACILADIDRLLSAEPMLLAQLSGDRLRELRREMF